MAIALIATASTDQASGNISITHGLTLLAGDVLVAFINVNGAGNTVADNNGSTAFTEDDHAANPDSAEAYVLRRVCGSSEPSAYAFTLGSSNRSSTSLRQYRGVDSSVWDVAPSASTRSTGSGDTTAEAPACTIATAGACGLVLMADDFLPTTTTYSSIDNGYANVRSEEGQEYQVTADKTGLSTGSTGVTTITSSANVSWIAWQVALKPSAATLEQEGFRFGVDDGSESTHTWEAAQDTNISTAAAVTKLLRLLANATGDPAAIAYKLKYAKNGGAYGTVPLVASTKTKPVIEAADCTVSGSNTASASWAVSHPAASTGDLLIFYIAWDDSTSTTDVTAPAGANSETLTAINATPVTDGSTETRAKAWYCVCTGAWTATTKTFTPTASESWSATVVRVPAGEFDATTPIGTTATRGATGVADTNVLSAAMTAGASDGGGALLWFAGVDTDPLGATNPTGFTILQRQDLGAVAHGVAVRDTEVTDSESIAGGDTWAIAGDSWTSIGVIVRAPTVTNDLYISASANITAGGEATTARLTAPSGKTTSDFVNGSRWDNENGTDTIDITTDDYTEVEWCITLKSGLSGGDYFDFRVYNGDTALDTYTTTPRWTISSAITLTVADATHTHAADAIALTASNYLAVTDATHTHAADAIALTASNHLTVADATHTHSADAITLTLSVSLSVTDATHTHAADAIALTSASYLVVTDATHTHASDAIGLTANSSLAVDDATHTHSADSITLTLSVSLVVQDATHEHAVDAITLSIGISLTVTDATHVHVADAIALTVSSYLAVTDATHTHAADAIALTASNYLAVTDATHTHAADAIALISDSHLVVQDATHEHATDAITLGTNGSATLTVTDATHEHAADAIALTANSYLAVTDATHTHSADAITLALLYSLSVDDATHLHASDAVTLTANNYLVVQDATHVHAVDAITLVTGIFMGLATLSMTLVDVADVSDANPWNAALSDTAFVSAGLSDDSIWNATLSDQARESATVNDEPL